MVLSNGVQKRPPLVFRGCPHRVLWVFLLCRKFSGLSSRCTCTRSSGTGRCWSWSTAQRPMASRGQSSPGRSKSPKDALPFLGSPVDLLSCPSRASPEPCAAWRGGEAASPARLQLLLALLLLRREGDDAPKVVSQPKSAFFLVRNYPKGDTWTIQEMCPQPAEPSSCLRAA